VDIAQAPTNTAPPAPHGAIGVATWGTNAQFKDIKVTTPAGDKVLYQSNFANSASEWHRSNGIWNVTDGALTQSSNRQDVRDVTGDTAWTDYTYTLTARKTGGAEGLLIMFHVQDADNFLWWNIGGWGNTRTNIESTRDGDRSEIGTSVPVTVQANRWYNIRIEISGSDIKCYLDDKLVQEATEPPAAPPQSIYATASRVDSTGQVIVKVANVSGSPQAMEMDLQGLGAIKSADADVMTGQPADQNSLANPSTVAPAHVELPDASAGFTHEFPAYSISAMRFDPR